RSVYHITCRQQKQYFREATHQLIRFKNTFLLQKLVQSFILFLENPLALVERDIVPHLLYGNKKPLEPIHPRHLVFLLLTQSLSSQIDILYINFYFLKNGSLL